MNETLLGSLIAFVGVIIGGLVSLSVEALKNNWNKSERRYLRIKEIVDRRCDQAETYAQAVTADFRKLMHEVEIYFFSNDPNDVIQTNESRRIWKASLDLRIFSFGPSIRSLSDDDIMTHWNKMIEAIEKVESIHKQVWNLRFNGVQLTIDDPIKYQNDCWLDYSRSISEFYKRLDQIRFELSEE